MKKPFSNEEFSWACGIIDQVFDLVKMVASTDGIEGIDIEKVSEDQFMIRNRIGPLYKFLPEMETKFDVRTQEENKLFLQLLSESSSKLNDALTMITYEGVGSVNEATKNAIKNIIGSISRVEYGISGGHVMLYKPIQSVFVKLFEEYEYSVEQFGDSYIADNGVFCVPFTEYGNREYSLVAAVSFLSSDKEKIKKHYNGVKRIGFRVFSDWMNDLLPVSQFGRLGNHDHSFGEVKMWLERGKLTKEA